MQLKTNGFITIVIKLILNLLRTLIERAVNGRLFYKDAFIAPLMVKTFGVKIVHHIQNKGVSFHQILLNL